MGNCCEARTVDKIYQFESERSQGNGHVLSTKGSKRRSIVVDSAYEIETADLTSIDLDIFALSKKNNRKRTYVRLIQRMVADNMVDLPEVNMATFQVTLETLWQSFNDYNVGYHNDMHCLDVAQMNYILLKTGPDCLAIQLQLSPLEQFASIMAAACHDFAHDGYNNGYHVANETDRFRVFGAPGTQEKFHFASSFKVLQRMRLIENMSDQDQKLFKKRMKQCILATDMTRHMDDLNKIKAITERIVDGQPILTDDLTAEEREERRSAVLELSVHSSDISFLARPFETQRLQAYKLFEEFFHQGDIEADAGQKISFLCDRNTTNVAKSQIGFIKFGPLPLFKIIGKLCPSKAYIQGRLLQSGEQWEAYSENESAEDKKTYLKLEGQGFLDETWV